MTDGGEISRQDAALIRSEIEALIAEFAYRIDHGLSETVADLFTEDGWYGRPDGAKSVGRDAIRAAYAKRAERGERTARHIFTNLRLTIDSAEAAHGTTILLLFAGDGPPPLPARPVMVQDYNDEYRLVDGEWRFAERATHRLFVDESYKDVLNLGR
jgi:ketosteroid isomerase-like protein